MTQVQDSPERAVASVPPVPSAEARADRALERLSAGLDALSDAAAVVVRVGIVSPRIGSEAGSSSTRQPPLD